MVTVEFVHYTLIKSYMSQNNTKNDALIGQDVSFYITQVKKATKKGINCRGYFEFNHTRYIGTIPKKEIPPEVEPYLRKLKADSNHSEEKTLLSLEVNVFGKNGENYLLSPHRWTDDITFE